jgi:hypothetical protein
VYENGKIRTAETSRLGGGVTRNDRGDEFNYDIL